MTTQPGKEDGGECSSLLEGHFSETKGFVRSPLHATGVSQSTVKHVHREGVSLEIRPVYITICIVPNSLLAPPDKRTSQIAMLIL